MRALYEINADLEQLLTAVDDETGELQIDDAALEALMLERSEKLEGMALLCKDWAAEAAAIRDEEKALAERRQRLERNAERMKARLQDALAGEKLETPRVAVTWRKSKSVEIDEGVFWQYAAEAFIRYRDPEPNKTAITAALKDGGIVPGATLTEKLTMQLK